MFRYANDIIDNMQSIGMVNNLLTHMKSIYFIHLFEGFIILAFVTDNNRVNQKFYSLLAPNGSYCIDNPVYLGRVIRLIFDTIHIFKNFRNNWINKKDSEKSFFYPKFEDFSIIQQACFQDLRDLHNSEKFKMIKTAPKLNTKTLFPSRFDRQRVPLVLNLIHPTTIAALKTEEWNDTAEFLEIIQKWFNIVNNRSPVKAVERINTEESEDQLNFLKRFVAWLEFWMDLELDLHVGGLTKDTFTAAISSTNGIVRLIEESFYTTNIDYFLCGKIQTNDLEIRFGWYRGLSGSNYNVSVRQIMESEKKLRMKKIISSLPQELKSSKYTVKQATNIDITPYLDLLDSNYVDDFNDFDLSSFMYVCGYGGYSLINKFECKLCHDLIIKSIGDYTNTDYFDFLQRGGLIVPNENCLFLLIHCLQYSQSFEKTQKNGDCFNSVLILPIF